MSEQQLYHALHRLVAAIDAHLGQVAVEEALKAARTTLRVWERDNT
jgi:hypothetical protein